MKLEDFGYNSEFEKFRVENNLQHFEIGRVISAHKELYTVKTVRGEYESWITGNLRFHAGNRESFPAVGDWVALTIQDAGSAVIHQILPRYSVLKRRAVGQFGEIQIMATNIDYALIAQAVDRDFNVNRLERYLTICYSSDITPVILLTKTDLINEQQEIEIRERIKLRAKDVPVIAVSSEARNGYDELKAKMDKGKTYCLIGSSGVGKSTLLNHLSGKAVMRTGAVSPKTNKGRHVTSHRELTILDNDAILVDNPGMREIGIADSTGGLEITFDQIVRLSVQCRFNDCTHTNETGCSVLEAVKEGEIEKAAYKNYLKMEKEKVYFESTVTERKKKDKEFGKFVKNYKKTFRKKQ